MSERERFEAWASEPPRDWSVRRYPDKSDTYNWYGEYKQFYVQTAWESWQAACPEGWQAVPKKPTGPMYKALKNPDHPGGIDFEALLKWDAVLAAAPQPEDKS